MTYFCHGLSYYRQKLYKILEQLFRDKFSRETILVYDCTNVLVLKRSQNILGVKAIYYYHF